MKLTLSWLRDHLDTTATVAEIADASGVAREEVADFVNANLATGYAEPATDPAADTTAPAPRGGGLLDRIRGR